MEALNDLIKAITPATTTIINSGADVVDAVASSATDAINDPPDMIFWIVIPTIIIYILCIIIIRYGFEYPFFSYCYNKENIVETINEKGEEEENNETSEVCMNPVLYNSLYFGAPLIISSIISLIIYQMAFYFQNPNLFAIGIVNKTFSGGRRFKNFM